MEIIQYDEKYRDDMIFMVLAAKDALGRVPRLNDDLLSVRESHLDAGDDFLLAIEDGRVVGCVGYSSVPGTSAVVLHRFYVKPELKRRGIGSRLLLCIEDRLRKAGKTEIRVHLGESKEQWAESYAFYPKHGFVEYEPTHMKKMLI